MRAWALGKWHSVLCLWGAWASSACGAHPAELVGEAAQRHTSVGIDGLQGTNFDLVAKPGHISTPDGNQILIWGFADAATGEVQYPGPTLRLHQGDTITVTLANTLAEPVSLIFPGMDVPTTPTFDASGVVRSLAAEAAPFGTATYTFTASRPGTFYYQSGTNMDKQVEMGLFGAIIVYPPEAGRAYGDTQGDSAFDRETLFLLSEMDLRIHDGIELGQPFDTSEYHPVYWFINGRSAPDTMAEPGAPWLPAQPYNCAPRMHPGERLLLRLIGMGRDLHPFHTHGNHTRVIAQDGRLLESAPGAGADLAWPAFTMTVTPGETLDAIYTWTGAGLGWDVYGHTSATDPMEPNEDPASHGVALPAPIPPVEDLELGDHYSGSPFLGKTGFLPPGAGLLGENGAYFHMWHSHSEREMTTNEVFPGGMMTMLMIEHPSVSIP